MAYDFAHSLTIINQELTFETILLTKIIALKLFVRFDNYGLDCASEDKCNPKEI